MGADEYLITEYVNTYLSINSIEVLSDLVFFKILSNFIKLIAIILTLLTL